MVRIGAFFFAWRNWLFTALLLGLLSVFPPVILLGSRTADFWLDVGGFLITLGGQALRIVVIGQSTIQSGGTRKKVAAEHLYTGGLLSHVRNPLYIGNVMVVLGLVMIHNNPWVYGLMLPSTLFAYEAIVANEEAFLRGRFGQEYSEYCRRVRRWLPRFRGLQATLRTTPIDWRRVLFQEYGSIYLAVALPLAVMLYEQFLDPPAASRDLWVRVLGTLLGTATAVWLWARRLKLQEVARRRRSAPEANSGTAEPTTTPRQAG